MLDHAVSQATLWDRALGHLAEVDAFPEDEVLAFLGDFAAGAVGADIGCGFGRHTNAAAAQFGLRVVGLDSSSVAVAETAKRIHDRPLASVVQASMTSLPIRTSSCDFALGWCVFNHGDRPTFERALQEAARVLKRGGALLALIMSRSDPRYGSGPQVSTHCFRLADGPEAGIEHYFPEADDISHALVEVADVERLTEIRYTDADVAAYHPSIREAVHFSVLARKR